MEQTASERAVLPAGPDAWSKDDHPHHPPASTSQEATLEIGQLKTLAMTAMDSVRNELVRD